VYLDGLEIAGLGAGMVFLALVVMLVATLSLRLMIDKLGGVRLGRGPSALTAPEPTEEPPVAFTPAVPEEAIPEERAPRDKAARAAAIAVALYLTEEEEEGRRGQ